MSDLTATAPQALTTVKATRAFPRRAQAEFLKVLAQWGNVRAAAKAVGISRSAAYRTRRDSIIFAELWDAALLCARPQVEEVLADRALNGVEEVVYYHGEEVATRTRYDSRLLLAHLGRLDQLEDKPRVLEASYDFEQQVDKLGKSPDKEAFEGDLIGAE
ncbi:MAG: hypothetical protein AAGI28_09890 [Pseudomonadota bacterium]